ncbi:cdc42 effector protein 5 isoform X1 [Dermochelys coriacea]|uniref:cdc42 effector protein 5 isoform X1 n=2 Tax=Dermochelys coriacea TaxID=27794 RepID=UPI0018E748A4|nr:cdc42 effector protein 5 isoform X1 [Dermochelys coriacea]XP_043357184.1 cdc42 effector protein 5 isoform X1 [Dermochelys coriacea]XP_043357185.1 cdc42 effector protein 5 isoform X1 [Dermochelys coriacea]XP_043357186.1 cdc42 effector protein 5 isoform X1 [Dermochelys coriacea]
MTAEGRADALRSPSQWVEMPILKQSPISQSKKRPRIGRDMISAPLGDFRHTMHVGRGGDAFGDTSFLSNHGGPKANGLPPTTEALAPAQSPSRLSGSSGSPADLGGGPGALDLPPDGWEGELQHAESLFSFELDLGPSILDEVLGVMDKGGEQPRSEDVRAERPVGGQELGHGAAPQAGEEEEEEEEGSGHGYTFDDELDDEIGL